MKRITSTLVLILLTLTGFSQIKVEKNFKIEMSQPYKVEDGSFKIYFSQYDEIMAVKVRDETVIIQKYNSESLKFIEKKKYDDFPKNFQVESIMEFNQKHFFFYSSWDKAGEKEQLFVREIDFNTGTFKGESRLIIVVDGKVTGFLAATGFWKMEVLDKFDFYTSADESKMVIQYRKKPLIKKDKFNHDIIGMHVFDGNMKRLWDKEVRMPYTEKKMNNVDYTVDSEGNSYLLARVFDSNSTKLKDKDGERNYHMELLRIKANTEKVEIVKLETGDLFLQNIWIFEGVDNNMVIAGFYNKGISFSNADGIFMLKVGKEGSTYDLVKYEIPVEILNQYVKEKTQKKNKKKDKDDKAEFAELVLRDFIFQEDGGIILIGEQYFVRVHTYTDSRGNVRYRYSYHYNDMLITKIDKNGNLAWMRKLPKRQTGSRGRGGMGYTYINHLGDHTLLFLDNIKNMALPLNKIPSGHGDGLGGFLTGYRVNDDTGEVTKMSFFDVRDVNGIEVYQFAASRIVSVSPIAFVVEVYKKKKEDVLIKVHLTK